MTFKKEICSFCKETILLEEERFVRLGTYEKDKTIEETHYHIRCFKRFWDKKIQESIMKRAKVGMEGIMNMAKTMNLNMEENGK